MMSAEKSPHTNLTKGVRKSSNHVNILESLAELRRRPCMIKGVRKSQNHVEVLYGVPITIMVVREPPRQGHGRGGGVSCAASAKLDPKSSERAIARAKERTPRDCKQVLNLQAWAARSFHI